MPIICNDVVEIRIYILLFTFNLVLVAVFDEVAVVFVDIFVACITTSTFMSGPSLKIRAGSFSISDSNSSSESPSSSSNGFSP